MFDFDSHPKNVAICHWWIIMIWWYLILACAIIFFTMIIGRAMRNPRPMQFKAGKLDQAASMLRTLCTVLDSSTSSLPEIGRKWRVRRAKFQHPTTSELGKSKQRGMWRAMTCEKYVWNIMWRVTNSFQVAFQTTWIPTWTVAVNNYSSDLEILNAGIWCRSAWLLMDAWS